MSLVTFKEQHKSVWAKLMVCSVFDRAIDLEHFLVLRSLISCILANVYWYSNLVKMKMERLFDSDQNLNLTLN